jgi:hypothetical protein
VDISTILIIIAGLLFLLDIILGFTANVRARVWMLTPIGGLLLVVALLVSGGAITS